MNIIALFLEYSHWQLEINALKLMSNGQSGVDEQQEKCNKAWAQLMMHCQAYDDALKIALTAK